MPAYVSVNFRCSQALRDKMDAVSTANGLPLIRIIETLLRDDLMVPAEHPGLAARIRKMAR